MLRDVLHDLRHGARVFARRPTFTLTAIVTVALAIAANTVVFSVVSAILLRPLPYPDAERLVSVRPDAFMSLQDISFVDEQASSFADVGGPVLHPRCAGRARSDVRRGGGDPGRRQRRGV